MTERSRVRIPAGAAREFSSLVSAVSNHFGGYSETLFTRVQSHRTVVSLLESGE